VKFRTFTFVLGVLVISCCSKRPTNNSLGLPEGLPSLTGTRQYLTSPFVTAGDRVYMVGYQDGSFPDLGWHIQGEMGGIWDHPIKLLDGFACSLTVDEKSGVFCLDQADSFTNYPIGNRHDFLWKEEQLAVERFQFAPDGLEGLCVRFLIHNNSASTRDILFSFTGLTDLRPTWLGERNGMIDTKDQISFDSNLQAFIARDANNPWYTAFGSTVKTMNTSMQGNCPPASRKGQGTDGTLVFSVTLRPKETASIPIFVAGSSKSEAQLRATYKKLKSGADLALQKKIERYADISRRSCLTIPDKKVQHMYEWLKYDCEWLVRNVPGQGIGVSAGLPDYPWWFGADTSYALQGILATGDHALAKNSLALLYELSRRTNGNGRIIHEASTNGAVYNPGNVNETAQFISALQAYFEWTGDLEFVRSLFPHVKKGINWLLEVRDTDGNGYPNGSGMMEIPGLDAEMIDVAVYTQQALADASEMAGALGEPETAEVYGKLAENLKGRINRDWWNAEANSFGDFRATTTDAERILEAAIVRADTLKKPWAVAELKETQKQFSAHPSDRTLAHVIYHNWVVNTPMETGVADRDKGRRALETARKYENAFGVFVTGIDRTVEPDSVVLRSRKKTFSYTGAVMTLPTGVEAIAAARYGTPDDALAYLKKLQRSFSYALPGSMYEVSPDFGMVAQAWNIYGVAVPIVKFFFGVKPEAYKKTISISPHLPTSWKEASLENIIIGDNALSLTISQKPDHCQYRILQTRTDWTLVVDVHGAKKVFINGREKKMENDHKSITVRGREAIVDLY
jgi:hypothetical protein